MSKLIFSVYEQATLLVGQQQNGFIFTEKHLWQLAQLKSKFPAGMYRLEYQSVRWGNYVGLVELPEVIIEILPKIDRSGNIFQTRLRWTQLLQQFDFLPQLGNLNPQLLMQPGELTETLQRAFISEVSRITPRGLARQYRSQQGQQPFLRGKLLLTEQIRTNLVQKHRFYVQSQNHVKDHSLNQRIKQALRIVAQSGHYSAKTNDLLRYFRSVTDISLDALEPQISLNRATQHYQLALRLANLICGGYLGGTFAGQDFGFSLLFDMSRVFELLVYYHLKKLSHEHNFKLHYQPQRAFWRTKNLCPDFLLELEGEQRIVIDTKWKVLAYPEPNDEDLRQVFAYTQVFEASRGILLYPQSNNLSPTQTSFNLISTNSATGEIQFLSILENIKSQLLNILLI
ncbi:McrC family protein [Tunicatimonas pelagia]|uniref:McrC family protein n=1 Tax=Tunicatimonas pelagia TaxID=931531 RepID=UPI002665E8BF|nr:hypothetical protein [Tunicatimonas pelagia]WKN43268.1 hypothetical protein P0M28_29940 [Tunicatimonas pelagia]